MLLIARPLGMYAWDRSLNPDDHVAPYLSAISDLLGTTLLVVLGKLTDPGQPPAAQGAA